MRTHAVIHKEEGETPLMALERFRAGDSALERIPLTYAGRLDPMASGKLLILIGDECKKRAKYDGLDKEYVFEVLLGFSSDTGDILGLAEKGGSGAEISEARVERVLHALAGSITLPYPAYSSKTVDGKPLFVYAHEGKLDEIEHPSARTRLYALKLEHIINRTAGNLAADIGARLARLRVDNQSNNPYKDFRRGAVLERWDSLLSEQREYAVARIRSTVSSGTYIRSLAPRIAQELGASGLAYSIERARIGRYTALPFGWGFWTRSY